MAKKEKQLHIRLSDRDYKKLKIKCVHDGTTMQNFVANLISESLCTNTGIKKSNNYGQRKEGS